MTSLNLGSFEFTGNTITTTDSSVIVLDQAVNITNNLSVDGDLVLLASGGTPTNSSTPAGYLQCMINGQLSYLPYYR